MNVPNFEGVCGDGVSLDDESFANGDLDPSADEDLLVVLFCAALVEAPGGFGLAEAVLGGEGPVLTPVVPGLVGLVPGLVGVDFGVVLERFPFTLGFVFTPDGEADLLFTAPVF